MGYFFNELIPPAILLDHPGVTKEEFSELLDQTHSGGGEYGSKEPWDIVPNSIRDKYHGGLESLAEILYWEEISRIPYWRPKPKEIYNFTKPKGSFDVSGDTDRFLWYMRDGRYYLDPETFNRMSASLHSGWVKRTNRINEWGKWDLEVIRDISNIDYSFGYTDLVLTAEAIKHGAWKLLSYRGLKHAEAFLEDFPNSRERVERAIWDSHTSLAAKSREMTVTEFLRMRLNIKP